MQAGSGLLTVWQWAGAVGGLKRGVVSHDLRWIQLHPLGFCMAKAISQGGKSQHRKPTVWAARTKMTTITD